MKDSSQILRILLLCSLPGLDEQVLVIPRLEDRCKEIVQHVWLQLILFPPPFSSSFTAASRFLLG